MWHLHCELLADSPDWLHDFWLLPLLSDPYIASQSKSVKVQGTNEMPLFNLPRWLPNRLKTEPKSLSSVAHAILPGLSHCFISNYLWVCFQLPSSFSLLSSHSNFFASLQRSSLSMLTSLFSVSSRNLPTRSFLPSHWLMDHRINLLMPHDGALLTT